MAVWTSLKLQSLSTRASDQYSKYVANYRAYARMRGFKTEINDWPYVRRSFIDCWAAPGFHRFWQIWNPGIAYFVYRLFIRLGGRRRWIVPTISSFLFCGLAHTLVVAPFLGRWSFSVITAFFCFGILTVVSRVSERVLRQDRWPGLVNVAVNVGLVCGSFDVGFRIDKIFGF
jgi:hypothetical protein